MKKRFALMAALLLLLTPLCALGDYEPVGVTQQERYNINLFLSNFSEQDMQFFSWERATNTQLVDFAIRHIRLNRTDLIEHGNWNGDTMRLSDDYIAERTERYFGVIPSAYQSAGLRYEGGYYYWSEGSDLRHGFACMSSAEDAGEGKIGVYFGVFASGDNWNNEDLALRPEQAAQKYPDSQVLCGYAVIDLGGGNLSDRSTWRLKQYDVLL